LIDESSELRQMECERVSEEPGEETELREKTRWSVEVQVSNSQVTGSWEKGREIFTPLVTGEI
jgi:uncharacterized protein related to proFAR isomerase